MFGREKAGVNINRISEAEKIIVRVNRKNKRITEYVATKQVQDVSKNSA